MKYLIKQEWTFIKGLPNCRLFLNLLDMRMEGPKRLKTILTTFFIFLLIKGCLKIRLKSYVIKLLKLYLLLIRLVDRMLRVLVKKRVKKSSISDQNYDVSNFM